MVLAANSEVSVVSGRLAFDGELTTDLGSSLRAVGDDVGFVFNASATIYGDLVTDNQSNLHLTVNGQVEINDPEFNWDASGVASTTTVNSEGSLTINADSIDLAGNVYNGGIHGE